MVAVGKRVPRSHRIAGGGDQYEQAGSIRAFFASYLQAIVQFGSWNSPFEQDARAHELYQVSLIRSHFMAADWPSRLGARRGVLRGGTRTNWKSAALPPRTPEVDIGVDDEAVR